MDFKVGDKVRYSHFGEWRDAIIGEILYPECEIQILRLDLPNGGCSWRASNNPNVVKQIPFQGSSV